MSELPVCPKCGWHKHSYGEVCDPVRGAAADRIAAMVQVPATKLGYGYERLTFEFSKDKSLTVAVHADGTFSVESLFWLGDQTEEALAAMVKALASLDTARDEAMPEGYRVDIGPEFPTTYLVREDAEGSRGIVGIDADDIAAGAIPAIRAFLDRIEASRKKED